jgi:hypothetical protein
VNALNLITLAITVIEGVAAAIPGGAIAGTIASEILAATAAIRKTVGTETTKAQLEGMRFKPSW